MLILQINSFFPFLHRAAALLAGGASGIEKKCRKRKNLLDYMVK